MIYINIITPMIILLYINNIMNYINNIVNTILNIYNVNIGNSMINNIIKNRNYIVHRIICI